jgi:hypothetical protein
LELLQALHNTRDMVRSHGLAEQDLNTLINPAWQKS